MILVVDMNWKKNSLGFSEFVSPIIAVASELDNCVIRHYTEVNTQDAETCDRVILSGAALKDNVAASQPEKFSWLKEIDKPVLGICAGMQALGVVLGSQLIRCLEVGMTPIASILKNPLFSGSFSAYSLHNYAVEPSGEFEVLAQSAQCVQAIKHKEKALYGVLFHPEVRNSEIIKRFIQMNR